MIRLLVPLTLALFLLAAPARAGAILGDSTNLSLSSYGSISTPYLVNGSGGYGGYSHQAPSYSFSNYAYQDNTNLSYSTSATDTSSRYSQGTLSYSNSGTANLTSSLDNFTSLVFDGSSSTHSNNPSSTQVTDVNGYTYSTSVGQNGSTTYYGSFTLPTAYNYTLTISGLPVSSSAYPGGNDYAYVSGSLNGSNGTGGYVDDSFSSSSSNNGSNQYNSIYTNGDGTPYQYSTDYTTTGGPLVVSGILQAGTYSFYATASTNNSAYGAPGATGSATDTASIHYDLELTSPVPEPASLTLLGLGGFGLGGFGLLGYVRRKPA